MTHAIVVDAKDLRARERMMTRYGRIIAHMGPRFSKHGSQEDEPALAIEGWAVLFNEPIGLTTGEIVVFEPGCFDNYLATKTTEFRFSHDSTRVVGSTNSGLELYVTDAGLAYRMPLINNQYASTIKQMVDSKKQSAISIGITRSVERSEIIGKHKVDFISECDLTEASLVAEGCCPDAFAYLIDANDSPSLKDSIDSPLFRLESVAHNIGAQFKKDMRRLDKLTERIAALQPTQSWTMTGDRGNQIHSERVHRMQTERRANLFGL